MTTTALRMTANNDADGNVAWLNFFAVLPTREDADVFAAAFPKAAKMRSTNLSGDRDGNTGYVGATIALGSNRNRGAANETGARRYRSIKAAAAKAGVAIAYDATAYSTSYATVEAFEAALEAGLAAAQA